MPGRSHKSGKKPRKTCRSSRKCCNLTPGMTVADIGAGGGAFTVVLGKWIGDGKVFATDIGERQRRETRAYADKEGLKNVTVIEGGRRPHQPSGRVLRRAVHA